MTRTRITSLAIAVFVLVAFSYSLRAATSPAEAVDRPTGPVGNQTRRAIGEIDRLIGVYEERIADRETATEYALLGDLYLRRGEITRDLAAYAAATDVFTRLLTIDPAGIEGRLGLARSSLALHDFATSGRLSTEILTTDPWNVVARTVAADVALAVGDFDSASIHLDELIVLDPGHPAVLVRRAGVARATGDREAAIDLAAAAAAAAPDSGFYLSFLAAVSSDAGCFEAALDAAHGAVTADPSSAAAHAELGRALAATGDVAAAIAAYRKATGLLPDPAYLSALGDLLTLNGDSAQADLPYDTVEAIAALDETGAYTRTLAYFYADHDIEAVLALDLAMADAAIRNDAGARDLMAWALYRNGRADEAQVSVGEALAINPANAEYWFHAALISEALGDADGAMTAARRALDLNPAFDPLQSLAARALIERLSS